ncbi:MAG: WcaI family glycosyltransferase [Anaerolineae bacterium]|nr:WcaI family glycosyltransferase [Anaerolineae bacterium]
MKLLVIGMNYAPEQTGIAPFTTELCEHLTRRGHTVTVATTFPHYPEWKTHECYAGMFAHTERRNGVTLKRKWVMLPRRASALGRVLYDTLLGLGALLSGLPGGQYDLILGVAPPIQVGVAARLLARRHGVPYVMWVQDLALEAAMSVGMMRASALVRAAKRVEQWTYDGAARVLVVARSFMENLAHKGVPDAKLRYLPDWVDAKFIGGGTNGNGFRRSVGLDDDSFVVLHSGNMGAKQQLQNVLNAARELGSQPNIAFVLVGEGSEKDGLITHARRDGLRNVLFLPLVPRDELPHLMATADLLVLNQHPDMVEGVIPSKLLTYMAAARPIVVAAHPDSEAARQVQAAGCGVWVEPNQPKALAHAVSELARDPAARQRLGERGRQFVGEYFSRERLLRAYETELLSVTG